MYTREVREKAAARLHSLAHEEFGGDGSAVLEVVRSGSYPRLVRAVVAGPKHEMKLPARNVVQTDYVGVATSVGLTAVLNSNYGRQLDEIARSDLNNRLRLVTAGFVTPLEYRQALVELNARYADESPAVRRQALRLKRAAMIVCDYALYGYTKDGAAYELSRSAHHPDKTGEWLVKGSGIDIFGTADLDRIDSILSQLEPIVLPASGDKLLQAADEDDHPEGWYDY